MMTLNPHHYDPLTRITNWEHWLPINIVLVCTVEQTLLHNYFTQCSARLAQVEQCHFIVNTALEHSQSTSLLAAICHTREWRVMGKFSLHTNIMTTRPRMMKSTGHVARMGEVGNSFNTLVGKSEGERQARRFRRVQEVVIKWIL
jgi:calcineurin-like phosphoesterase